jgi:sugar lactone lactonase YvrE/ABC-type Fe3+ transport system permease subunit
VPPRGIASHLIAPALGLAALYAPFAALLVHSLRTGLSQPLEAWQWEGAPRLLLTGLLWSLAIAVGAALVGWIPGLLLGRRRSLTLLALLVAMVCIPSYIMYYAWGLLRLPGSPLGDWIAQASERAFYARQAQAYLGLLIWTWPLCALCVAAEAARTPRERQDLGRLEPAGWFVRLSLSFRDSWRGLLLGVGVATAVLVNSFAAFHLADIPTYTIQLDLLRALNAEPAVVGLAGLPAVGLALVGGGVLLWAMRLTVAGELPTESARARRWQGVLTWVIWGASFLGPAILMLRALGSAAAARAGLASAGGIEAIMGSLGIAVVVGPLAGLCCAGLALGWVSRDRRLRGLATAQAFGWLVGALMPGTIVAAALGAAYNRPGVGFVYNSMLIVVLAHLVRTAVPMVLLARYAAARMPTDLRDMQELDGVRGLVGRWQASGRYLAGPALVAGVLAGVLSLGEVATTVPLLPPGRSMLGALLLNQLHYARDEVVLVTCLLLYSLILLLLLAAGGGRTLLHRAPRVAPMLLLAFLLPWLPGCERAAVDADRFQPDLVFGGSGYGDGQFAYPRAIALDRERDWLYVVDKAGRVQRFDYEGVFLAGWAMPKIDRGKPVGLAVGPDGLLYIADTHEQRVMVYTPQGELLRSFGSYGKELGQFIYLTDVAFADTDQMFVGEYGSNDRVTVFSLEGEARYAFGHFGYPGEAADPESLVLNRPQCLRTAPDGESLWIADACNHRLLEVSFSGEQLQAFGLPGERLGEMQYPYGLDFLPDGTLVVAEYGNSRVQRFEQDGEAIAVYGEPGRGPGEFASPWGIVADGWQVFVLDSRNNRVQRFAFESIR